MPFQIVEQSLPGKRRAAIVFLAGQLNKIKLPSLFNSVSVNCLG